MELGFSVGNGCPLWFWSESPPEVECFKPFRFLFTGESRRWLRESIKVKLLIYRSIYIPTLIYSNELWVVTEGMRVQMVEMSFLWRVSGLSLRLRTLIIWESNSHYIPPHQKKVVWLSGKEVSRKAPRWSGFLGGVVQLRGEPGYAGEMMFLRWFGNTSVFLQNSWRRAVWASVLTLLPLQRG